MVDGKQLLPKRVVAYIHDMGVRALDHLSENIPTPAAPPEGQAAVPNAVQSLVMHWKSMSKDDKESFVEMVAESVVSVVAASAVLPLGLKLGKKAVKATGKVLRKQAKKIKKATKAAAKSALAKAKPKAKAKK